MLYNTPGAASGEIINQQLLKVLLGPNNNNNNVDHLYSAYPIKL